MAVKKTLRFICLYAALYSVRVISCLGSIQFIHVECDTRIATIADVAPGFVFTF
jgi:hypothetical protein